MRFWLSAGRNRISIFLFVIEITSNTLCEEDLFLKIAD